MKTLPITIALAALTAFIAGCQTPETAQTPSAPPAAPATAPRASSTPPADERVVPGIVDARPIMRAKLAQAQAVLRGLTLEDFRLVKDSANALLLLSQETDWQVHRTLPYNLFSTEFRRITRNMIRHAEERDTHGVTVDYTEMTLTCVKCHSYMRREGLAADMPDLAPLLTALHK